MASLAKKVPDAQLHEILFCGARRSDLAQRSADLKVRRV
jgi:hypothetical protein